MRAIHLLRKYNPDQWGGTETAIQRLFDGLRHHNVESIVYCPELEAPAATDPLLEAGYRIERFHALVPIWGISAERKRQLISVGGNLLAGIALWVVWIGFGWVPIAGWLIEVAAILVTWILATVGFGAALLSRLGLRDNFAGRFIAPEMLTDEYLWATPQFGVPAVQRPKGTPVPPGRTPPPGIK